jgi:magnesium chelatase accessory protein
MPGQLLAAMNVTAGSANNRGQLLWERDGANWPNSDASIFVRAGGIRWHVQRMGGGPALLLLHGTGAATHSWRGLMPLLARHFAVVAPDLPGHGFTDMPGADRLTLPGMSSAVDSLLNVLDVVPAYAAGHSAGAAILARMSLRNGLNVPAIVSLNGALLPLGGVAGYLFSPLAKLLATTPLLPMLFAHRAADRSVVERLLRGTGSTLDAEGIDLYARLMRNRAHVTAALSMMANWDLHSLQRQLPTLKPNIVLVAGSNDLTISAEEAFRVRDLVPQASVHVLRGLGHLAHEERPARIAEIILAVAGLANDPQTGCKT